MGYYYYEVEFWDEIDNKKTISQGVVYAKTYEEALGYVSHDYGDEFLINIYLEYLNTNKVFQFNFNGEYFTKKVEIGGRLK